MPTISRTNKGQSLTSKTPQKGTKPANQELLYGGLPHDLVDESPSGKPRPAHGRSKRQSGKKNSLEDHERLVESFRRQGTKFRSTLKYGFPVVARRTGPEECDDSKFNSSLHPQYQKESLQRLNQTMTQAFKNRRDGDPQPRTPLVGQTTGG